MSGMGRFTFYDINKLEKKNQMQKQTVMYCLIIIIKH